MQEHFLEKKEELNTKLTSLQQTYDIARENATKNERDA